MVDEGGWKPKLVCAYYQRWDFLGCKEERGWGRQQLPNMEGG